MRILVLGEYSQGTPAASTIELALVAARLAGDPLDCAVLLIGAGPLAPPPLPVPLVTVEHSSCARFEAGLHARVLAAAVRELDPAIVLAAATSAGRAVLPAAAASLRCGLTADCTGLSMDPLTGDLLQVRPAFGGSVMATIASPGSRPQLATVRPRSLPVPASWRPVTACRRLALPESTFDTLGVTALDAFSSPGLDHALESADVIVAGGRGLRRSAGFGMLGELARLLNGSVAASRSAVEAGWIGHEHQVGLSGRVVSPRLYVAVGISGAVQHLAGMRTSGTVVAINRDPRAPIMQAADLALVGDAWVLVPNLIERLRRGGGLT